MIIETFHIVFFQQEHLYDILPGMDLSPTNPVTLKPQANRSPLQVSYELLDVKT